MSERAHDEMAAKWAKLAEPFELDQIELLPKPYKKDSPKSSCAICGGYHGQPAVHLHYVGHAGITMRLNEVDPYWNWEPMALNANGTPQMSDGGMWIKLTILGVTRIGFGDAQGKTGPNATKEIIGDAIRNGAMRFGVGTYLWSKSEAAKAELTRQGADDEPAPKAEPKPASQSKPAKATRKQLDELHALRDQLGVDSDKYAAQLEHFGVTVDTDLTKADADKLLATYRAKAKEAEATDE